MPSPARAGRCLKTSRFDNVSESETLAEGEGFEPPVPLPVQWFSRPPPSTTRPSLRVENLARIRDSHPQRRECTPVCHRCVTIGRTPPPNYGVIRLSDRTSLPSTNDRRATRVEIWREFAQLGNAGCSRLYRDWSPYQIDVPAHPARAGSATTDFARRPRAWDEAARNGCLPRLVREEMSRAGRTCDGYMSSSGSAVVRISAENVSITIGSMTTSDDGCREGPGLRVSMAVRAEDASLFVTGALRPASRRRRVIAAFFAAAFRRFVAAAFSPAARRRRVRAPLVAATFRLRVFRAI